jgi:hypothetical protein
LFNAENSAGYRMINSRTREIITVSKLDDVQGVYLDRFIGWCEELKGS